MSFVNAVAIGGPEICNTPANPVHCSLPDAANRLNVSTSGFPPLLVTGAQSSDNTNYYGFFIENMFTTQGWTLGATPASVPVLSEFVSASCSANFCAMVGASSSGITLGEPLIISSQDGLTWTQASLGHTPTNLTDISCNPSDLRLCVAVGSTTTASVAYQYTASTSLWQTIPTLTGVGQLNFKNVYCNDTFCLASGDASSTPYLYQTTNEGVTWSTVSPSGTAPTSVQHGLIGNDAPYYLVVWSPVSMTNFDYALSTDGGTTWSWLSANGTSTLEPISMTCTTGVCYLSGINRSNGHMMVFSGTTPYGASNWTNITPASLSTTSAFIYEMSCGTNICVGVGGITEGPNVSAILIQSISGGGFSAVPLSGVSSNSVLNTVSCKSSYCLAAGVDYGAADNTSVAILLETKDGGVTWNKVNVTAIHNFPNYSEFAGSD